MDDASSRGPARHANGRFGPGNPGRPRGSRNRMPGRVARGLLRHYTEHEKEILERLNSVHFTDYMRLIGRLLPRCDDDDLPERGPMSPEQLATVIQAVRHAANRVEAGEGSVEDIEAALAGAAAERGDR